MRDGDDSAGDGGFDSNEETAKPAATTAKAATKPAGKVDPGDGVATVTAKATTTRKAVVSEDDTPAPKASGKVQDHLAAETPVVAQATKKPTAAAPVADETKTGLHEDELSGLLSQLSDD